MRQCPYCKAQIGENARFCLYCMKPLSEKEVILPPQNRKHLWLAIAAGVALVLIGVILVLVLTGGQEEYPADSLSAITTTAAQTADSTTEETNTGAPEETTTQGLDDTTAPAQKPENTQPPEETATGGEQVPEQTPANPQAQTPGNSGGTTSQKPTQPPIQTTPPTTVPTTAPTTAPTSPTQTETPTTAPEETTQETTLPESQPVSVAYTYRAANAGDEHTGQTVDPENDIVITGVKTPSADGVYHIPSYIDGKRVIAIGAIAFNPLDVKEVVLGETIRNVDQNAFIGCYNIAKFYVSSDVLYISRSAFTDATRRNCTLTFYSSAQCLDVISDDCLKDAVFRYRAEWKEWDGSL